MLKDFTYICISYNQEDIIIRHLESIVGIIKKYGQDIKNYLIVADDCSRDNTVNVAEKWISDNSSYFEDVIVIKNKHNLGTVKNIYNAIHECKTDYFKVLAGDDMYYLNNIYNLFESINDEMVVTPIIPLCEKNTETEKIINSIVRSLKLVSMYSEKNKVDELVKIKNHLMAPGVFFSSKYWRDEEIRKEISKFKYIEDVPMWINLIVRKKLKVVVKYEPYICYQLSVSNRKINEKNVQDIRKKDYELLEQLYARDCNVSLLSLGEYYLKKIICMYTKKYDNEFLKNDDVRKLYFSGR